MFFFQNREAGCLRWPKKKNEKKNLLVSFKFLFFVLSALAGTTHTKNRMTSWNKKNVTNTNGMDWGERLAC
jgi:hypothetical protein